MPATTRSTERMINAIESNWLAFGSYVMRAPHVEMHRERDFTWYRSAVPSPMLNGVCRLRGRADPETAIERGLSYFRPRGLPVSWWVWPSSRPHDLADHLCHMGLNPESTEVGMAVEVPDLVLDKTPRGELSITLATGELSIRQWADVLALSFGLTGEEQAAFLEMELSTPGPARGPYWRYTAFSGEEPVGTGCLFLTGRVAGLYNIGVAPGARGQGVGAALTNALLHEARRLRCRLCVLTASPAGRHVYQRAGFLDYCRISQFVWRPGGQQTVTKPR